PQSLTRLHELLRHAQGSQARREIGESLLAEVSVRVRAEQPPIELSLLQRREDLTGLLGGFQVGDVVGAEQQARDPPRDLARGPRGIEVTQHYDRHTLVRIYRIAGAESGDLSAVRDEPVAGGHADRDAETVSRTDTAGELH